MTDANDIIFSEVQGYFSTKAYKAEQLHRKAPDGEIPVERVERIAKRLNLALDLQEKLHECFCDEDEFKIFNDFLHDEYGNLILDPDCLKAVALAAHKRFDPKTHQGGNECETIRGSIIGDFKNPGKLENTVEILSAMILAAWLIGRHLKPCPVDKIKIAAELFDALIVYDPDATRRQFSKEPSIYYGVLTRLSFNP